MNFTAIAYALASAILDSRREGPLGRYPSGCLGRFALLRRRHRRHAVAMGSWELSSLDGRARRILAEIGPSMARWCGRGRRPDRAHLAPHGPYANRCQLRISAADP